MKTHFVVFLTFCCLLGKGNAQNYVVTNTSDNNVCNPGNCSLRGAINAANTDGAPSTITFNFSSGSPPFIIQPNSVLPALAEPQPFTIDATTNYSLGDVIIDGSNAGNVDGIRIVADNCTVRGLVVRNYTGPGGRAAISLAVDNNPANCLIANNRLRNNNIGIKARPLTDQIVTLTENNIFCNDIAGIDRNGSSAGIVTVTSATPLTVSGVTTGNDGVTIEVFKYITPGGCTSAFCQGRYLATTTANGGVWSVSIPPGELASGDRVTATGISLQGNTTEFAPCEFVNCPDVLITGFANIQGACNIGALGAATVVTVNNAPPYTYAWDNGETTATATQLTAGVHTVTVTDSNGCTGSDSVNIPSPDGPVINAANNGPLCAGETLQVSVTASGQSPFTFEWATPDGPFSDQQLTFPGATPSLSGGYTVTVTDNIGCQSIDNTNVLVAPNPTLDLDVANVTCNGDDDGAITLSVSPGNPGNFSFSWSNGATTQNLTGLGPGSYSVTATNNSTGCSATGSAVVLEPNPLNPILNPTNADCFGAATGSVTLLGGGGIPPYDFLWNTGATTVNLNNVPAGNYSVTITDNNGCTVSASTIVGQPSELILSFQSADADCDVDNGMASVIPTGGTPPYSFNWSNGANTAMINNLPPGNYAVTVTDDNGCLANGQASVGTAQGPTISLNVTDAACFAQASGSITLNGSGGAPPFSFNWSNGATSQNLSNIPAGNYSVTVTDDNGCTATGNATVGQPTELILSFQSADADCDVDNGMAGVIPTGGTPPYSFNWSNGANTAMINNLPPGNYAVTVTDDNGCLANGQVSVGTAQGPTISLNATDAACFAQASGSITLNGSGGQPPFSFNWSNGATSQNLSNIPAGNYSVTVTDSNGCAATANATVGQPTELILSFQSADADCDTDNGMAGVIPTGGTPPYSFNWSNGANIAMINNLPPGNYSVTVTDDNGCLANGQVSVGTAQGPTISLNATDAACFAQASGSITLNGSGGQPPFSFNWSNGATSQNLSNIPAGNYSVTVTDDNGCTATGNATVGQPTELILSFQSADADCDVDNGMAGVTPTGGTPPYSFNWSNGANTAMINNLPPGNYAVTVTDDNGCLANGQVSVGTAQGPTISLNATDAACFAQASGSITLNGSGGQPPFSFNWSNGATSQNLSNIPAGNYSVTVTDSNGCAATANATVGQPTELILSFQSADADCDTDNGMAGVIPTGGTPPYSFNWSNGANTAMINNLPPGNYAVTVTDDNGCLANGQVSVGTAQGPTISLNATDAACFAQASGSITLNGSGGQPPFSFNWSNGATSQNLSNIPAGNYSVTVTDSNGCAATANATVGQPDSLALIFTVMNAACGAPTGGISVAVSGGVSPFVYQWNNGGTTENIQNLSAGLYLITVTDANGCTVAGQATVSGSDGPNLVLTADSVSCNGATDGSITLTGNGGTAPYNLAWSNGAIQNNVNTLMGTLADLPAGDYSVTVTDDLDCEAVAAINVGEPSALALTIDKTDTDCDQSNGSASATVTGGLPPYSYAWSNGGASATINNLTGGTYTLLVTDANNCTVLDSVSILNAGEFNFFGLSISPSPATCAGDSTGSIDLSVGTEFPPLTYMWNTGDTIQDLSGLAPGTYSVTITDGVGCQTAASTIVTEPEPLSVSLLLDPPTCGQSDGSATAVPTGGAPPYSYNWSDATTDTTQFNLSAGAYSVFISDSLGCSLEESFTLVSEGQFTVNLNTTNIACAGDSTGSIDLEIIDGPPINSYLWNTGDTVPDLVNLGPGNYVVTVTDNLACQVIDSTTVTEPAPLVLTTAAVSDTCGAGLGSVTVEASGGTAPYAYAWNTGDTTPMVANLTAGSYLVTVTDAGNCTAIEMVEITGIGNLAFTLNATDISCAGADDGAVSVNLQAGIPPVTYSWNTGDTTAVLSNLPPGQYSVTLTDSTGCTGVDTIEVSEPAPLTLAMAGADETCSDANGSIAATPQGGVPPYQYAWNSSLTTNSLITGLSQGLYIITVTDDQDCMITDSLTIANAPAPTIELLITSVTCFGDSNGSIIALTSGATIDSINWSTGMSGDTLVNLPVGTYQVTVTDVNGCEASATATVDQPPALGVSIETASAGCGQNNGAAFASTFGGVAPYSFQWSAPGDSSVLDSLPPGDYALTVTDANECSVVESFTVSGGELPVFELDAIDISCNGQNNGAVFFSFADFDPEADILWSNGALHSDTLNNLEAGSYAVTVTNPDGCFASDTISVNQPAPLGITIETASADCGQNNGGAFASAFGGVAPYSFQWSAPGDSSVLDSLPPGDYALTVTDANACQVIQSFTIAPGSDLLIDSVAVTDPGCPDTADGSISFSVAQGTPPLSYAWSNGQQNNSGTGPVINNLSAGIYAITLTDQSNCSIVDTIVVNAPVLPSPDTASITQCGDIEGIAIFDLTTVDEIVNNGTGLTVIWQLGEGELIENPAAFSTASRTVFAALAVTGCLTETAPVSLTVLPPDHPGCAGECQTFAGTMSASELQTVCPGEVTVALHEGDQILEEEDGFEFILHDQPGTEIGTVLARSLNGSFTFDTLTMAYGATYYLSAVAGNETDDGAVDLTDECLSVATGAPVVFIEPPGQPLTFLQGVDALCQGEDLILSTNNLNDTLLRYNWILASGDTVATAAPSYTAPNVQLSDSGEYFVFVSGQGCIFDITGPFLLSVEGLPEGEIPQAGNDTTVCTDQVLLQATPLSTGNGYWRHPGEADISDPDSPTLQVQGLAPGRNVFIWTGDFGNCAGLSPDTVFVDFFVPPAAADDLFTLEQANTAIFLDIFKNDILPPDVPFELTLLSDPAFGTVALLPNGLRYQEEAGRRGEVTFEYQVCYPEAPCGEACATARVTIDVLNLPYLAEGITPNGDGINDQLTVLGVTPSTTDVAIKLTITNRWGDVVYQSDDYLAAPPWDGRSQGLGKTLPEGAYYGLLEITVDDETFTRTQTIYIIQ